MSLVILSGAVFLNFSLASALDLFNFIILNQKTDAESVHLKIFETKNQHFQIEAEFSYLVSNKSFKSKEVLKEPIFDNPYQLRKVLEETKDKSWEVYYSSSRPEKGSLQREFSIKKIVDFILSLGLFLYFILMGDAYKQNPFKILLKKDQ